MAAPRNKEDGAPSRPRPTPAPAPTPVPTPAPPEDLTNLLVSSLDENPFASIFDEPIVDIPLQVKTTNTPAVDINKVIATNEYGGALPYSQLSPEDQAVVDARRAAAAAPTVEPYKGVERQSYGEAQQLTSAEEALNNYLNFFSGVQSQMDETNKEYSLLNYDPSEFVRAGFTAGKDVVGKAAGTDIVTDYIIKNNVPLSKEINGQTYYLTTGLGEDVLSKTMGKEYKGEGEYAAMGPVGTYSTVYVKPTSVLDDNFLKVMGMIPIFLPIALMTTVAKIAAGESVSPLELVQLAVGTYDILTAPAATAATTGNVNAPTAPRTLDDFVASGDALSLSDQLKAIGSLEEPLSVLASASEVSDAKKILDAVTGVSGVDAARTATAVLNAMKEVKDSKAKAAAKVEADAKAAVEAQAKAKADADAEQARLAQGGTTTITDPASGDETIVTGKTPDMPPSEQPDVTPIYDQEPIVYEPPADAGGGAGGGGADAGGDAGNAGGTDTTGGAGYPTDTKGQGDSFSYDPTQFYNTYGDTWLKATFETLDADGDGVVTAEEMDSYERSIEGQNKTSTNVVGGGTGTGTGTGEGTAGTGTAEGDTGATGGGGVDGTGGSSLDTGTSETGGTGTGDGTGAGAGAGTGTGTGTGEGTGEGEDTGTGTGIAGVDGMLSPTRTTDLLFADLFKSNVNIGSNQEISPYVQFGKQEPANQGMLTNQQLEILKRYYS